MFSIDVVRCLSHLQNSNGHRLYPNKTGKFGPQDCRLSLSQRESVLDPSFPLTSSRTPIKSFMMNRILATVVLLVVGPAPSVNAWTKRDNAHGKTIIAYYASWQWYDRKSLSKPSNHDHSKVTRYNFAFFQINKEGDIWGTDGYADPIVLLGEDDWSANDASPKTCSWGSPGGPPACAARRPETGLIFQAHEAGVEVYPSIGGWTLSDDFPALAADPMARAKFANNCVELIKAYDFDGIDIDWEYPGYVDHMGTPEDTVNYSLFLSEIKAALDGLGQTTGRSYGLTAALPCGPNNIQNIQVDVVSGILDELNLMTYDFHGSVHLNTLLACMMCLSLPHHPSFSSSLHKKERGTQ